MDIGHLKDEVRNADPDGLGLDIDIGLDHDISIGLNGDKRPSIARSHTKNIALALGDGANANAEAEASSEDGRRAGTKSKADASVKDKGGVAIIFSGSHSSVKEPGREGSVSDKATIVARGDTKAVTVEASGKTKSVVSGDGQVEAGGEMTACADIKGIRKRVCHTSESKVISSSSRQRSPSGRKTKRSVIIRFD